MNSESNLEKYQRLLRGMFQFDCADLDFGIYRIMNYKRDVIEQFITKDLPKAIEAELDKGALAEQSQATKKLKELEQQIRGIDAHAIDADGNLADNIKKIDIGKKYLRLKEKTAGGPGREALEAAIFNHLYTFFGRYYQDGDFISKRRYSKRQKYAIPYNGEEVYLYWANNDQYYIKTAEHFHDYTFTSHGVTVHFKLTSASVEQDNIKGDRRFFLPRCKELDWDENADWLVIPFEYRPLTEQEQISYGKKNQQEAIIARALEEIPKQLGKNVNALRVLTAERRKTGKGESVSYLEHHLRQYTRRNTSDFFIHKDLKGFLSRELDFYLKNEVLNLGEMEAAGEGRAEGWFQLMRVIKTIGSRIIDFLAQIENFQKMLWEKRKFITETQYCITVGNIAEDFYPEIAECEPQWEEWKALGFVPVSNAPGNASDSDASAAKGWHSRGYLPHFDAANIIQSISFRLHDSIPVEIIDRWKEELHWTEQTTPDSKEAATLRKRIAEYEDSGKGACYLRDERIAEIVQGALKHFDGVRYHLIAWCIMPNHLHVLIETKPGYSLSDIAHSWKSFTAHEANKLLGRSGTFWMPDYFDRFIRDEKHFAATVEYIRENPVKAGLVDSPEKWPWSGWPDHEQWGRERRERRRLSREDAEDALDPEGGRDARAPRIAFLKSHPTLVLDTKHFRRDFVGRLLASFDGLDEMTDGLLIHGENFQALNLLLEKYRDKVKCIYIDPPYNTGNDEFIYRDNYQHSSWLSMIQDRLYMGNRTLSEDGLLFISIDDIEQHKLRALTDSLVGPDKLIGQFVWKSRQNKDNRNITGASIDHEYVFAYGQRIRGEPRKKEQYRNPDNDPRGPWVSANMVGILPEAQRPNCHYDLIDPETGINYRKPKLGWRYEKDTMNRLVTEKRIIWPSSPDGRPRRKVFLSGFKSEFTGYSSLIASGIYTRDGTSEIDALFSRRVIGFPKPTGLVRKLVQQAGDVQCVVMDYFAGSGTTAHAVINLNREDSSKRKFILVEIGEYFDTILLPRIKKVTFTPEWKDGKPRRMATAEEAERSPRIVKYIRLEGYEDALNNIEFDEASGQQALKFDDYLLKYMLQWETRKSETLLNVEKLASPFRYTLHIHEDGQTRKKVVDIPETFNYLLGLHVTRRLVVHDGDRRYLVYRGRIDHREIAVIWRETKGWTKENLERDKKFVAEQKLTEGADEVFVNGDSFIPKAKALEPVFKGRMFSAVEA